MPRHKNQVNLDQVYSDPDTEIMSSSIPHTEIKSISTTHTKHLVKFDTAHKKYRSINFDALLKSSKFYILTLNPSQFWPFDTKKQAHFDPDIKAKHFSPPPTKTTSILYINIQDQLGLSTQTSTFYTVLDTILNIYYFR